MTTENITMAFDLLVEEFERAVAELSSQSAEAFAKKDFKAVTDAAAAATRLTEFQKKVGSLEEDWDRLASGFAEPKSTRTPKSPQTPPSKFHALCIHAVEKKSGFELQKQTRSSYATANGQIGVVCSISRQHSNNTGPFYWFGFRPEQAELLKGYKESYLVLGCGSEKNILKIPFRDVEPWTKQMNATEHPFYYWHIRITHEKGHYTLHLKGKGEKVDLTRYIL